MTTTHPAISGEPDLSVSTATRVPTDPELKAVDRQIGWLSVGPRSVLGRTRSCAASPA
ncbi:MAG: hypothetical protein AAF962_14180 [Actinomycetota bacterium]